MIYLKKLLINSLSQEEYIAKNSSLKSIIDRGGLEFTSPVTFFIGENGTGKSTLLEAIAVSYGFNAEGGTVNFNFSSVPTHSSLYKSLSLAKGALRPKDGFFLRAESFYNVASEIDRLANEDEESKSFIEGYGGKSLHCQSHGESFISVMANRFSGKGLYLLDEPEAALSVSSQFALLKLIDELVKNDSQFIIATHSPIISAYPDALIYEFTNQDLRKTSYYDTDNYMLTKRFLQDPESMMRYLFSK